MNVSVRYVQVCHENPQIQTNYCVYDYTRARRSGFRILTGARLFCYINCPEGPRGPHSPPFIGLGKEKANPVQAWFYVFETTRLQDIWQMKVARLSAPRNGRLYPIGDSPGTNFCLRLSRIQDHNEAERVMSLNNSNRTRDLPTCSAVLRPNATRCFLSYLMRSGVISWGKSGRAVKLATHLQLLPRLRMNGELPPPPHMPSQRGQRPIACNVQHSTVCEYWVNIVHLEKM
jgi:hypothetical protein